MEVENQLVWSSTRRSLPHTVYVCMNDVLTNNEIMKLVFLTVNL